MLRVERTITMNGTSFVNDNSLAGQDAEIPVATMTATISENGTISTSSNIYNESLYRQNKDSVLSDINEFSRIVYETETEDYEQKV